MARTVGRPSPPPPRDERRQPWETVLDGGEGAVPAPPLLGAELSTTESSPQCYPRAQPNATSWCCLDEQCDGPRTAQSGVDLARIGTPHPSQLNTTQTAIDGLDLLAMADYACAETLGRVGRSELS